MPTRHRATPAQKACRICGRLFGASGLSNHERKCERDRADKERNRAYEEKMARKGEEKRRAAKKARKSQAGLIVHEIGMGCINAADMEFQHPSGGSHSFDLSPASSHMDATASLPATTISTSTALNQPELDDIKLEWHPSTGRPPEIHHFAEYQQALDPMPPPPDEEPWRPFRSRLDFEFAELALKA